MISNERRNVLSLGVGVYLRHRIIQSMTKDAELTTLARTFVEEEYYIQVSIHLDVQYDRLSDTSCTPPANELYAILS